MISILPITTNLLSECTQKKHNTDLKIKDFVHQRTKHVDMIIVTQIQMFLSFLS